MPIEIIAAVQLLLYGVGWTVAAILIPADRRVLAHWAVYALLESAAAFLALPAFAQGLSITPATLAVSFLSYVVGLRGLDLFPSAGPRLGRHVAVCAAVGLVAMGVLTAVPLPGAPDPYRPVYLAYAAASAVLWLGAALSLWRRMRRDLPVSASLLAIGPGTGLGVLATLSFTMTLLVGGDHLPAVREAARLPNLIIGLVSSALFHFAFIYLFVSRLLLRLRELARRDHLTGVLNRGAVEELLELACAQHARRNEWMAVVMVDVDHFKAVNDTRGHAAGDRALQLVARTIQESSRAYDLVGRWGGEEFVVVMPGAGIESARAAAERFRVLIEHRSADSLGYSVTASIGVAVARGPEARPESLLAASDRALYEAKRAGRNRVSTVGQVA